MPQAAIKQQEFEIKLNDVEAAKKVGSIHTGFGKNSEQAMDYVVAKLNKFHVPVCKKDLKIIH